MEQADTWDDDGTTTAMRAPSLLTDDLSSAGRPKEPGVATALALRVSVVITSYNYARFLPQAIESVLAQTYPHVECIVVDDGSTDGSQAIIARYPNVTALSQHRRGQAQALRAGCAVATGDILISLDADDYLYGDACASVVSVWDNSVACVNYKLDLVRDGIRTGQQYPGEPLLEGGHIAFLMRYGYFPSAPMSGNAFSRAYAMMLLDRAQHLDGDGVDAYLLYSAPVFGTMRSVARGLGVYRMHGHNISMSSGRKTAKNLGDHIYYQYWAHQNFQAFASKAGLIARTHDRLLGPYLLLWWLIVKNATYTRFELPPMTRAQAFRACARAFLTYPRLGGSQRAKNIALAAILAFAPRPLRDTVLTRLVRPA